MAANENDSNNCNDRQTRRQALKLIAGSATVAISFPILDQATPLGAAHLHRAATAGRIPGAYLPKFFSADQLETVATLAENIIPADEHSPGARAARVHEFIDYLVADSAPARKESWVEGLAALDKLARREYGAAFRACSIDQQTALLSKISANEERPTTAEEKIFVAVKSATIAGYYTSAIGIHQELDYQGNTALGDFEGCNHKQHKNWKAEASLGPATFECAKRPKIYSALTISVLEAREVSTPIPFVKEDGPNQ